jgi:hypothetical protein
MNKTVKTILSKIKAAILGKVTFFIIHVKYAEKIKKFKDIHKGERCFIVGNGPSLRIQDLEKLKNESTFATNKIFVIFGDTSWRPTYYCIQDFQLIMSEIKSIKQNVDIENKFIAGNPLIIKNIHLPNWVYFFLDIRRFYPNRPLFSQDISKQIFEGFTVTYASIQLAVYMGFSEIYLLGIDFNYSVSINNNNSISVNNTKDYFSDKYMNSNEFGKGTNYPNLENSLLAYKAAKEFTEHHGIRIYNATRGGKLEVFERIDFDSLFKKSEP